MPITGPMEMTKSMVANTPTVAAAAGWPQRTGQVAFGLIVLIVGLNPFPHTTTIQQAAYYLSLLLTLGYLVRQRDHSFLQTPLTLPVALFTGWACLGLFFAIDLETSLHDFRAHLLEYIALYVILVTFVNSKKRLLALGWLLVLSMTTAAALELYKFYGAGGHPWGERFILADPEYPVGPFGFMAFYAALFALTLLRLQRHWGRLLLIPCLLLLLATVACVQTRAILIAMPFAFLMFFWHKKKAMALALVLSLAAGGFIMTVVRPPGTTTTGYIPRLTINYISYLLLKEHPVVGIGFGISTFGNPKFIDHQAYMAQVPAAIRKADEPVSNPHNMWLEVPVRTGVVGLALFVAIVVVGFRQSLGLVQQASDEGARLWGMTVASTLVLFCIYGLFNAVFLDFLETLLCLSLALPACVGQGQAGSGGGPPRSAVG